MKRSVLEISQTFCSRGEEERGRLVREKIEGYLKRKLESGNQHPHSSTEKERADS